MKIGQKVKIDMIAADSRMAVEGEGIKTVLDTRDVGTGIILALVPVEDHSPGEESPANMYQVAVIDGRFDPHRNDLGELCIWESELTPL